MDCRKKDWWRGDKQTGFVLVGTVMRPTHLLCFVTLTVFLDVLIHLHWHKRKFWSAYQWCNHYTVGRVLIVRLMNKICLVLVPRLHRYILRFSGCLKLIHTCARLWFFRVFVTVSKLHKVWHLWGKQGANSGFCSHIARKTEGIHAHGLAYGQPTWKYHFQYKAWQQTRLVPRPRPASIACSTASDRSWVGPGRRKLGGAWERG